MTQSPSSTLSAPEIDSDPLVELVLTTPLDREFEQGDEYVYCFGGRPVRILEVSKTFKGIHPERSSYSFVWLPTLEQAVHLMLVGSGRVVHFDHLDDGDFMASSAGLAGVAPNLRAAAYALLVELKGV